MLKMKGSHINNMLPWMISPFVTSQRVVSPGGGKVVCNYGQCPNSESMAFDGDIGKTPFVKILMTFNFSVYI